MDIQLDALDANWYSDNEDDVALDIGNLTVLFNHNPNRMQDFAIGYDLDNYGGDGDLDANRDRMLLLIKDAVDVMTVAETKDTFDLKFEDLQEHVNILSNASLALVEMGNNVSYALAYSNSDEYNMQFNDYDIDKSLELTFNSADILT